MTTLQVEQVLVVPTELFRGCGYFQGFCNETEKYLPKLLSPEHTSYRPRDEMEQDPSFKQLIPYCIFRHRAETGEIQLFQYTRGSGQGESRLHSLRSVGIGGHISSSDEGDACVYQTGMERELEEEVLIDTNYSENCVGLINDDGNDVGKVHLGVVHLFDVDSMDVRAREDEIESSGFRPVEEIMAEIDQFETWSQICLRALFG